MRVKTKHPVIFLFATLFVFLLLVSSIVTYIFYAQTAEGRVLGKSTYNYSKTNSLIQTKVAKAVLIPTSTPTPISTPTPKPTSTPIPKPTATPTPIPPTPTQTPNKIYTAEKIGDSTWKIVNVQNDASMATPQEIFSALNAYRTSHGAGVLSWNSKLGDFAQSRASTFNTNKGLDSHQGFKDFMSNSGFAKAGFNGLGENSAYLSGPMNAEKITKEIFGADSAHDGNQLDGSWTHAGVGVAGNGVNVNFGKNKI